MAEHDPDVMPYTGGPTEKWVVRCGCGLSVKYETAEDAHDHADRHREETQ